MTEEQIKEALEIIKQPITVNCEDYHYFDQENYDKLVAVYDNCQWFINNFEQIIDNCNELKSRINKAIEYIKEQYLEDLYDDTLTQFQDNLLEILKGEK